MNEVRHRRGKVAMSEATCKRHGIQKDLGGDVDVRVKIAQHVLFFFLWGFYKGFLKWWYPTTLDFPTKNDNFEVFWGYHHLRKHPRVEITTKLGSF